MFKNYDKEVNKIVLEDKDKKEWGEILVNHKMMLARIQKERLIHLIVTVFVGIVLTLILITTIIFKSLMFFVLSVILLILFIGYLLHYRFLENTTQNWYRVEDTLIKKVN